jgi:membrane protein DedA with SNARE-associated domain
MLPQLLLIALATLASEDLTCIATGVLIAQGKLGFAEGTLACLLGIFIGDIGVFMAGRIVGMRALHRPLAARFLTAEMVEHGANWLQRRGLVVVILSRFTPGLRLPTYFAAGALPTRLSTFIAYFLVASAIWTPLLVGATAVFGAELLRAIFARGSQTLIAFGGVFAVIAGVVWLLQPLLSLSGRRKLVGFVKRKVRWEFWPPVAIYLPLAPYLVYLAIRHRSFTVFTAANPGIETGGFVGESKSRILAHLSRLNGVVPEYTLITADLEPARRVQIARRFMTDNHLQFPVVLKPDVGERGSGVAIVRTDAELEMCLTCATTDLLVQRYVDGAEFGVFYYRYPDEPRGRIYSITGKHFPTVKGDGRSTLRELILSDSRAVCMAGTYERLTRRPLQYVPAAGEPIQLVEIGSHCRGAVFLNAFDLKTTALEEAIDRISRAHPGFYFGRFDIRAPSVEEFRQGRSFRVIELNGVSSEATHIYDPSVSLLSAYKTMFNQWRIAFEIGSANRARGAQPMTLWAFILLLAERLTGGRITAVPAKAKMVGETG